MAKNIYVAATSQHVGKTTSTLGLVAVLQQKGINVGYCKPVGQQFVDLGDLKVDKDALLFARTMNFELVPEIHSPVILGKGATTAFLDQPDEFDFPQRIYKASGVLEKAHDLVIYEGTGHPGVGSVVNLSNARVASMLNASVVMVVEGGIGSTIDRLNLSIALFRKAQVPIIGVIVNKVLPDKIDKVRKYVGQWLESRGMPLLGVLPYQKSLSNPIMETIIDTVNGQVLMNEEYLDNRIEGIIAGSLVESHDFQTERDLLLVSSGRRLCEAIDAIEESMHKINKPDECPLAGVIITGDGKLNGQPFDEIVCTEYLSRHRIPVISTHLDTYGSAVKISGIEVKINTRTPWKVTQANELIRKHINLEPIISRVGTGPV
ncbi:MAG: AAA family ATPase [Saprospiraceae bacterium]|nr:AAA family ATPase [Lewinella sp.]